jgi:hypothetical protein
MHKFGATMPTFGKPHPILPAHMTKYFVEYAKTKVGWDKVWSLAAKLGTLAGIENQDCPTRIKTVGKYALRHPSQYLILPLYAPSIFILEYF